METRQRRSFTDDYKRQAVDLVTSRSMLRRTATCWPTSLSIVLPNVLLHEEQSTRRVVLRPPSALSKMCSGLVFSVNSFSQKMHLAISRLSKLSGWFFFGIGAGGRSRTGTGLSALRIFLPATAFAASPGRVRASARLWSGLSLHRCVYALWRSP
jgi:hypothetical protein